MTVPLSIEDLRRLPRARQIELVELVEERQRRYAQRLFFSMYPDDNGVWEGPPIQKGLIATGQILHARHLYPKHLEFFSAGARYRERCGMCANRVGKTLGMGAYEMAAHLTGLYPEWWDGRVFEHPVSAWAAGKGFETTRDIMQLALLGEVRQDGGRKAVDGRGMIPGQRLGHMTWKSGVQDLVDTVIVRHVSGGWSDLTFKSYEQGRGSFEGTGKHVIWDDEEPPLAVYGEQLMRTATLNGIIMVTFTPLEGMTETVMQFLPADQRPAIDIAA